MPNDPSTLIERVSSSFSQLLSVSTDLNTVSDELGTYVAYIDAALRKLNLGLTVWTQVSLWQGQHFYRSEQIGYAKINGKWGIGLRRVEGDNNQDPDELDVEQWSFGDAPRALRLEGIGKLPELLETLSKESVKAAGAIKSKLAEVRAVAAAMNPDAGALKHLSSSARTVVKNIGEQEGK